MSFAKELFKQAIVSGRMQSCSGTDVKSMGEECASAITHDANKDPVDIITNKALSSGLNRNQIERLVENTNHAMMRQVLNSEVKTDKRPIVSKNDVFKRLESSEKQTATGFEEGVKSKPIPMGTFDNKTETTKEASVLGKFAQRMSQSDMSDYMEEPVSFGMYPLDEYEPDPELDKPDMVKAARERGYASEAVEYFDGQIGLAEMDYEVIASNFAKVASQYVVEGTPFLDVIHGALIAKPEKSTVELLKMATIKCYNRGVFTNDEAESWLDALDVVKDSGNPAMDKAASLGLPVSESLINKSIDGRVRILNGDSHIIKMLNRVGDAEQRLRKMRLARQSLFNEPEAQYARKITNVSGE